MFRSVQDFFQTVGQRPDPHDVCHGWLHDPPDSFPAKWRMLAELWILKNTQSRWTAQQKGRAKQLVAELEAHFESADLRHIRAFMANAFHRNRMKQESLACLEGSLHNRMSAEERALVLRNMAKVRLSDGDVAGALDTVNRIRIGSLLPTEEGYQSLQLLRARILLNMSADEMCQRVLATVEPQLLIRPPLPFEYQYLKLTLDLLTVFDDPKAIVANREHLAKAAELLGESQAAFYQLEALLYQVACHARSIRNRQAFEAKCRHLGRVSNNPWLGKLTIALLALFSEKAMVTAKVLDDFFEQMSDFQRHDSEISFQQVGLLTCHQLLQKNRVAPASQCLKLIQSQIARLRGQLPLLLQKQLDTCNDRTMNELSLLSAKLPRQYQLDKENAWLLGSV